MKKFKNIKLMLIGLCAMMSVNAFAADNDVKPYQNLRFRVISEANKTAEFVGVSQDAEDKTKVTIPATVSLQDDAGTSYNDYTVTGIYVNWANYKTISGGIKYYTEGVRNTLKELTIECRLSDWTVLTNALTAGSGLTVLEKLTVTDAHLISSIPAITAPTTLKEIDFSGVSNDGQAITFGGVSALTDLESIKLPSTDPVQISASAFAGLTNLTNVNFGTGKLTIDASAFKGCTGKPAGSPLAPTAITFTNLDKAISIGANAFENCYITNIVIGENVASIGADAFKSATPYATAVTYNSEKVTTVPAVFGGQSKIAKVTVDADAVTTIASGAFTAATGDLELNFTNAPALKTITGAFAAATFTKLLLKGSALEGNTLAAIGIDHSNAQNKLTQITFPEKLKGLEANEFQGYAGLTAIDFSNTLISVIPNYAFEGTNLAAITIPVNIKHIGDYAFANIANLAWTAGKSTHNAIALTLSDATELGTLAAPQTGLGTGAFEGTNISSADFSNTKVYAYPQDVFKKSSNFHSAPTITGTETNFLTSVKLATAPTGKKITIGADAFANNPKLKVENYNQAAVDNGAIAGGAFAGTAMTELDLSATGIVDVPASFSGMTELQTVTLNPNTKTIAPSAFEGDANLKFVNNLNQAALEKIGASAFKGSIIEELDLSAATKLWNIGSNAFEQKWDSKKSAYAPSLKKIIFPAETKAEDATKYDEYTNKIEIVGSQAFLGASTVTEITNLKDCKLGELTEWFTRNDNTFKSSNSSSDILNAPEGLTSIELPTEWEFATPTTSVTEFSTIAPCALQGLGIKKITIPATVTRVGEAFLQGCVDLEEVIWNDAQVNDLSDGQTSWPLDGGAYIFRGNKNMKKFEYMTVKAIVSGGLTDEHFYWCSKEKLTVYVTAESLLQLKADGYTTANAKYSKLNDDIPSTIKFRSTDGEYYYAQVYDEAYATWLDADVFEVFTAKINGNKIDMVAATTEKDTETGKNFYKIKKYTNSSSGSWADNNGKESVAIVRAKKDVVEAVEKDEDGYYNLEVKKLAVVGNNKSTLATDNDLLVAPSPSGVTPNKLGFFFKLGKVSGKIGFYRVTSGTFKPGTVYINAPDLARGTDFLPLNFDGDATAIQGIETAEFEDGAAIYNLQGVRVNATQKGMYIKNGKKFIVK